MADIRLRLTELAVDDWKSIGNRNFVLKRYEEAVIAYTKGIEQGVNLIDLMANRSACYLALSEYKLALDDAESVLYMDEKHFKCINRKVAALFGMKLYKDAVAYLENIELDSIPPNERRILVGLKTRANSYVSQSEYGDYPWLYRREIKYLDMADFTKSVIIKDSAMKGRGLFATKTIQPGELILASKAWAFVEDTIPNAWQVGQKFVMLGINSKLTEQMEQMLNENPKKCQELYRLYAGPEMGFLTLEEGVTSNVEIVDKQRIESISTYNRFAYHEPIDKMTKRMAGIWITPSYLNHSCVDSNSSWLIIGDFLFVRAVHTIRKDEEILICYQPPNELNAHKSLRETYDFECSCRLCQRDRLDDESVVATRATIFNQLETALGKFKIPSRLRMKKKDEHEILGLFRSFERTRRDAPELNCCLFYELLLFGVFQIELLEFVNAANTFEKLYKMCENIPTYSLIAVEACMQLVMSYAVARKFQNAQIWIRILKKKAIITFGTDKMLEIKYPTYMNLIRANGLNV
ncbi:hypothetical protein HA402_008422 [Bradysia odoriphaga]|nr:hypothetical protein HA402_008422 [Bradysia odoriphaga]